MYKEGFAPKLEFEAGKTSLLCSTHTNLLDAFVALRTTNTSAKSSQKSRGRPENGDEADRRANHAEHEEARSENHGADSKGHGLC